MRKKRSFEVSIRIKVVSYYSIVRMISIELLAEGFGSLFNSHEIGSLFVFLQNLLKFKLEEFFFIKL